jgi:hypothetical protein
MEKMIVITHNLLRIGKRYIIFYGLGIFALFTAIRLLHLHNEISAYKLYEITIISIIIIFSSLFVYRISSKKFACWDIKYTAELLKQRLKYGLKDVFDLIDLLRIILLISPISNILRSIGLAIFILTFVDPDINILWQNIHTGSSDVYKFIGLILIIPLIVFTTIFLPTFFFHFFKNKYQKDLAKYIMPIWILILSITISILIGIELPFVFSLRAIIVQVLITLAQIIIGFIPLGWFYELFISSIITKDKSMWLPLLNSISIKK